MNKLQKWLATNLLGMDLAAQTPRTDMTTSEAPKRPFQHRVPRVPAWPKGAGLEDMARMYAMAVPNRFNQGFPSFNTSEDLELTSSLRNLRARGRSLVRDAAYAKSCKRTIVNNVIGYGVRMEPVVKNTRNTINKQVSGAIADAWAKWMCADSCHTGGSLHFHDLERLCMGQVFEAGEVFIRIHRERFGKSDIPIALEVVEPERIVDGYAYPTTVSPKSGGVRLGIESDGFKRPIAYWIRALHPGDIRLNLEQSDEQVRVPAEDVIHIYVIERWPQSRGVPWIHAVAGKLQDVNGYSEAEIIAARAAASYMGIIESPEGTEAFAEQAPDTTFQATFEPGMMMKLQEGEKFNSFSPNRPNSGLDAFMKIMLREISAGVGASYEAISHDYSQGSYSSMRVSMLAERDCWRALQHWWIRCFRERLHKEWLSAAVLSGAVPGLPLTQYALDMERYQAAVFKPRGWSWIDPTKEVAAARSAVNAGFQSVENVVEEYGRGTDLQDMVSQRKSELEYFREEGLVFDTSPEVYVPAETRGQVLVNDDGSVMPAAELAAKLGTNQPGAQGQPGGAPAAQPSKPSAVVPADEDDEPAGAEGEQEERQYGQPVVPFRRS